MCLYNVAVVQRSFNMYICMTINFVRSHLLSAVKMKILHSKDIKYTCHMEELLLDKIYTNN